MTKEKAELYTAIWTPTDASGKLLKNELKAHLKFLASKGMDGVLVGGSTGEFLHLTVPTRKELLDCIHENKGKLKIVCNVSHPNPREVEELTQHANGYSLEGVILLPPLYYSIAPQDLAEYFIHMAGKSKNPFHIYSFPEYTNVSISLDTIEAVCNKVPLAGIKASGSDLSYMVDLIYLAKKRNFKVYSGKDTLLAESLLLGADGCMGGLLNAIPEIFSEVAEASFHNRTKELQVLGSKLRSLQKPLKEILFPLNVAALMEARGLAVGTPKRPIATTTAERYQKLIQEYRLLLQNLIP